MNNLIVLVGKTKQRKFFISGGQFAFFISLNSSLSLGLIWYDLLGF